MRTIIFLLLIQSACAGNLPKNPRFTKWGTPVPARSDLKVIWNAPTNALPARVWIYRLLPMKFPPRVISNVMNLCSFNEKEKIEQSTNGVTFVSADKSRRLDIFFPLGTIEYQAANHYSHTNLAEDVPTEDRMPALTTNALNQIGIGISDIERASNGTPNFHFFHPLTMYYVNHSFVTNIEFRGVRFKRSVDGGSFVGLGAGGDGEIDFGEHSKIVKIDVSWQNLERYKAYGTIPPELMIKLIRRGMAVHGPVRIDLPEIDWASVKSVSIEKAKLCYYAGDPPTDWLYPFAALWVSVDTGHGHVEMEIDCPIIGEN